MDREDRIRCQTFRQEVVYPTDAVMEAPVDSGNLWRHGCGRNLMLEKWAGRFSLFPGMFYRRPGLALCAVMRVQKLR